jgi:hypothetical protein
MFTKDTPLCFSQLVVMCHVSFLPILFIAGIFANEPLTELSNLTNNPYYLADYHLK